MAAVWRRLQRASKKKAAKYVFTATLEELIVTTDDAKHRPTSVVLTFMHRRRKVSSKERNCESSYSATRPDTTVIRWPEPVADSIEIKTTLYKGENDDQFDDKEWTIVVEEVTTKGRRKPLAAVPLNLRLFIHEDPTQRSQLKLKLRPLGAHVSAASLMITLASAQIGEITDAASTASSREPSREPSAVRTLPPPIEAGDPNAKKDIADISVEIQKLVSDEDRMEKFKRDLAERRAQDLGTSQKIRAPPRPPPLSEQPQPAPPPPQNGSVRPPWRVEPQPVKPPPLSLPVNRNSRAPSTEAHFEVTDEGEAVPVPPPGSPPFAVPARIPNEDLLVWCQRVTTNFKGVRINDFEKSWRSGLGLCALVAAYRPEAIGVSYSKLDFTDAPVERRNNVQQALKALDGLGVKHLPPADDILTPDKKAIKRLLEAVRNVLEGGNIELPTPTSASDWRLSFYQNTDQENKVVEEIENIRRRKEQEEAVNYSNVKVYEPPAPAPEPVKSAPLAAKEDVREVRDIFDSDGEELKQSKGEAPTEDNEVVIKMVPIPKKNSTGDPSPSKHRIKIDEQRLQVARQLIEEVQSDGQTFQIKPMSSSTSNLYRSSSTRSRTSLGSNGDLRILELAQPSPVKFHSFSKRDPSPVLPRKNYDKPILPALGKSSERLEVTNALDRVKRFGSMRSQELRESIAKISSGFALPMSDYSAASGSRGTEHSTPNRKITAKWEEDVRDARRSQEAQARIQQRIDAVTKRVQNLTIEANRCERSSEDEERIVRELLASNGEKNRLVLQLDYYNSIDKYRDIEDELHKITPLLNQATTVADDEEKTEEMKRETDRVFDRFTQLMEDKERCMREILDAEHRLDDAQEDEDEALNQVDNFRRGPQEPLTASRRFIANFFGN